MGAGFHGGFGATRGLKNNGLFPLNLQYFASKAFEDGGHVSEKSFSGHAEYFLGKSVRRIEKDMNQIGYKTHIEHSTHKNSKAKKIVVDNNSKTKNITSVLVSPGSKRHGETSYVKVSTSDTGRYKIVSNKENYKSDGQEKAKLYFARRKKKK